MTIKKNVMVSILLMPIGTEERSGQMTDKELEVLTMLKQVDVLMCKDVNTSSAATIFGQIAKRLAPVVQMPDHKIPDAWEKGFSIYSSCIYGTDDYVYTRKCLPTNMYLFLEADIASCGLKIELLEYLRYIDGKCYGRFKIVSYDINKDDIRNKGII